MKQLPCALVFALTLAGLVAGTPYGYGGVNSGAVAKAEAGAVAGAFGGLPIPVPVPAAGGAYSGSYSSSKSSASSFASSSAHSSSFSFSGSGTHPEVSNGGGSPGCATGNCQGANDITSGHNGLGKTGNNYGAAGSGSLAAAGAVAGSLQFNPDGSPCSDDCVNKKPANCAGPNCDAAPNKCASGQCGSASSPNNYNNDDIPVNINSGSKNNYENSGAASLNKPQEYGQSNPGCTYGNCGSPNQYNPLKAPGYRPSSPGCTSGNCGSPNQFQPNPTDDDGEDDGSYKPYNNPTDHNDDNDNGQYKPTTQCDSGNCNGNGFQYNQAGATSAANAGAVVTSVTKPATTLNVPYEANAQGTKCTSPNCGGSHLTSNPVKHPKPSSYNVPLYPGRSPPGDNSGCASGDCWGNSEHTHTSSISNSVSNNLTPSYVQPTNAPQPTYTKPKCNTPGCNSEGSAQTQTTEQSPNFIPLKDQSGTLNCASGNCGSYPTQASVPTGGRVYPAPTHPSYSHGPAPVYHTPTAPSGTPGCGTPNCGSYPNPAGPISKPSSYDVPQTVPPAPVPNNCGPAGCGAYPTQPNYAASPAKQPVYTGGFGAPSGILKPNDFSAPKPLVTPQQQVAPKPYYPTAASQNISPTQAVSTQGSPKTSTASYKPEAQPHYGHNHIANAVAAASANAVAYSGGFGGPPGLLKPYDGGKIGSGPVGVGSKYQGATPQINVPGNNGYNSGSGSYAGSLSGAGTGQVTPQNVGASNTQNTGSGSYGVSLSGAAAGAQAGAISGFENHGSPGDNNGAGGCHSGCNGNSGRPLGAHDHKGSLLDGFGDLFGAANKGLSGAFGSSSSSASAHASAGALSKGYGRR